MRKRNPLFIIVLAWNLFLIISCTRIDSSPTQRIFELNEIKISEIFSQSQYKYYSLIYSPTCLACKSSIEIISKRYAEGRFDIYFINSVEVENKEDITNIGVNDYHLINARSVPLLLYIEDGTIQKEVYGFESIQNESFVL